MHAPSLFDVPLGDPVWPATAALDTPLGALALTAEIGAAIVGGTPTAAFRVGPTATLLVWDLPAARAELLLATPAPASRGPTATGARAGLWRVRAVTPARGCVFTARWASGRAPGPGGPASGQMLAAQTWDDGRTEVTLGAPDAEGLGAYARSGPPFPAAWRAELLVAEPYMLPVEDYPEDGIRLRLPALAAGELAQVHFAAAWSDVASADDASWFAADVAPVALLASVREAAV